MDRERSRFGVSTPRLDLLLVPGSLGRVLDDVQGGLHVRREVAAA